MIRKGFLKAANGMRPLMLGILASAGLLSILCPIVLRARPVETVSTKSTAASEFKYVGGTEQIGENCRGKLEVTSVSLVFSCPQGSVEIPYDSIVVMQYRSDISRTVRRMNLDWILQPWSLRRKNNRYFTLVYTRHGQKHALVLDVSPDAMRPYLAEIDLKAGRRVDVENHEKYDF